MDIHDLDHLVGRYVDISDSGQGAAGFITDVMDDVAYDDRGPFRQVALHWGQGWTVRPSSVVTVATPPPHDTLPGNVRNPVETMHQAMHSCDKGEDCPVFGQAREGLKAFRRWQMKQSDLYWHHTYIKPMKAAKDDLAAIRRCIDMAHDDGAPDHILDHMRRYEDWRAEEGAFQ